MIGEGGMNPKQKLTNLIGRILGVGELPSASELDLCLETATDNEIRRLFWFFRFLLR